MFSLFVMCFFVFYVVSIVSASYFIFFISIALFVFLKCLSNRLSKFIVVWFFNRARDGDVCAGVCGLCAKS